MKMTEFYTWSRSAKPYDFLPCHLCMTMHLNRDCGNPKHLEFRKAVVKAFKGIFSRVKHGNIGQATASQLAIIRKKALVLRKKFAHLYAQ